MKFLIDESVEKAIVDWLRDRKHDVIYVAESSSLFCLSGLPKAHAAISYCQKNHSLDIPTHNG